MLKTDRPFRLRRCQLAVPGSSEKMMKKASGLDVDYVFLDLEDAVTPEEKKPAREKIVEALNTLDWGDTTRCVRVNDPASGYCYGDIIDIVAGARERLDVIMVPKVMGPADVLFVDKLLTQLEIDLGLTKSIGLECLIEEVEALVQVDEIASSTPRLEAMIFGMGDYSASQGIPFAELAGDGDYPADIWHYQRQRIIVACRANHIDAVDGPYPDFNDPDGYRRECRRALLLGATGKWAIHPNQVAAAQDIFSPSAEEIEQARAIKAAYDDATARGLGAVTYEGKMIDVALIRMAQNVIDRADVIGA